MLDGRVTAQVTGYGGQSGAPAYTTAIGTVTNGTASEQDLRRDVPCGNGLTETDNVYSIQPGETLGWSVLCSDVFFTSGATVTIVRN